MGVGAAWKEGGGKWSTRMKSDLQRQFKELIFMICKDRVYRGKSHETSRGMTELLASSFGFH